MNIESYLKEEFEAYPRHFRDVSEYLAKSEVVKALTECPKNVSCPNCGEQISLFEKNASKGVRYNFQCSKCGKTSGPLQKTPFIAYWQLMSSSATKVSNPLLNDELFFRKLKKINALSTTGKIEEYLLWAASLNWLKWVWSKHRFTESYNRLPEVDKLTIDSLGFCIDELRRKSILSLSEAGFDIKDKRNAPIVELAYSEVKSERKSRFELFKEKLSADFSVILKYELFPVVFS